MDAQDVLIGLVRPARLWSRAEVLVPPSPVPSRPGVYGWYFKEPPWPIDTSQCVTWDDCTLLYGGIAPKAPPANGRPASQQTLRKRIRYHYTGNAAGSTYGSPWAACSPSGWGSSSAAWGAASA
jgi:hypothetical protein